MPINGGLRYIKLDFQKKFVTEGFLKSGHIARVNDQLSDTSIFGYQYRENGNSYDRRSCARM